MHERRLPVTGRLVFGFVVIALGVLFTLDNLGMLEAGEILRWWPAALLAYGLTRLTGLSGRQSMVPGVIFTLAGALLLLHEFGFVHVDPWDLWPVVLVVVGGSMVAGAMRRTRGADASMTIGTLRHAGGADAPAEPGATTDSTFSTFVMWSGVERKVVSPDFRGGDVTAIMGGAEIDLRQAKMPGGRTVIDLTVLWGGVDLYVPGDWTVTVEALPLMAGIEDATRAPAGEIRGNLVVKGVVLMGGVEIKN
jgi:predicted membrane protein